MTTSNLVNIKKSAQMTLDLLGAISNPDNGGNIEAIHEAIAYEAIQVQDAIDSIVHDLTAATTQIIGGV
ncbi:MAG: hypothetical protein JRG71_13285 [Deltaproteobacteria bacterium]|nr:hypothetical protein [Deltaproteobacteria bacterium]